MESLRDQSFPPDIACKRKMGAALARFFIWTLVASLLAASPGLGADLKVAKEVAVIARDICYRPSSFGVTVTQAGRATGSISSGAIVRRFGQAGLSATRRTDATRYSGLPQSALASAAADYNRCVQNMVVFLTNSYVVVHPAPAKQPRPQAAAPNRALKPAIAPKTAPSPPSDVQNRAATDSAVVRAPASSPPPARVADIPSLTIESLRVDISRVRRARIQFSTGDEKAEFESLLIVLKITSTDPAKDMLVSIPAELSQQYGRLFIGWSVINDQGTNCDVTVSSVRTEIPTNVVPTDGTRVSENAIIMPVYARCENLIPNVPVGIRMRFDAFERRRGETYQLNFSFPNIAFEG